RDADGAAGEAAAGAGDRHRHAGRRHAADRFRRACHLRHQPRSGEGHRGRQAARGSVPSAQRVSDPVAAAARARYGPRAARAILPGRVESGQGHQQDLLPRCLVRLYQHPWPGNVRELKNYVQRNFIMADDVIECEVATADPVPRSDDGTTITIRVGTPLEEVERRVTMATLAYCGHVKRKAAEILGVSLKTLYNRLETYGGKDADGPASQDEAAQESLR